MTTPPAPTVQVAATADLSVAAAHRLWALRADVFVVEQDCPYADLDGRDLEPTTRQVWVEEADGADVIVTATLRLLEDDDVARIGRVATAASHRGRGLAALLMAAALDVVGERDCVLDAQSHLTGWYARFGFDPDGDEFIEDGIPHTPMRRVAASLA